MKKFLVFLCTVVMLFSVTSLASATLVDFENLGVLTYDENNQAALPDTYSDLGWTLGTGQNSWTAFKYDSVDDNPPSGVSPLSTGYYVKGSWGEGDLAKAIIVFNELVIVDSISFRSRLDKDSAIDQLQISARWDDDNDPGTDSLILAEPVFDIKQGSGDTWGDWVTIANPVGSNAIDRLVFTGDAERFWMDNLSFHSAPVPEPATMLLLGAGLIGLAGLGRKKFFKKS